MVSGNFRNWIHISIVLVSLASSFLSALAIGAEFDEEITVVATTPLGGFGISADKLAFNVQVADSDSLAKAQSIDVASFLGTKLASVNINSAQGNPLQPDVQYRGYTASPLLGLPMGIAVFQNGARINEPLGDAVNWDLLPESAIHHVSLVGGANPLYGLNTLGGALAIEMKDGFNAQGHNIEVNGGSWGRHAVNVESGASDGRFAYYANLSYFDETGWRDLSGSESTNLFIALGWRGLASKLDFTGQYGTSELTGNGAAPIGLLALDRSAIFTAPDITENDMHMFGVDFGHTFTDSIKFVGNGFYRNNITESFNGDASEYLNCALDSGNFLLEELSEDALEDIGFTEADLCVRNVFSGIAGDPESLEDALNVIAGGDVFNIDDLTNSVSGTGVLEHEAINNQSKRKQKTYGVDAQFTFDNDLLGYRNYFVMGFAYFEGIAQFNSVLELSEINPARSTAGLGLGSFIDEVATRVRIETGTWSTYFMDALDITDKLTLSVGGRFNGTHLSLRDRSGARPELNGDHNFDRFNPSFGLTYNHTTALKFYGGYSESSRAPTPIELVCNDKIFEVARAAAIARDDDPDDVNFECRLPNAFLADPPLDEVVAKSWEFGVRGRVGGLRHNLGFFRTRNENDIIFQTTGRSTGLFANIDATRRQGVEAVFSGYLDNLNWSLSYSFVDATFEQDFLARSPTHNFANDNGEITVRDGDRIPGIPQHQFKFDADYEVNRYLALGFDIVYNSDQVLRGDESNQLEPIDGYAYVNLRARFQLSKNINLFAKVTNLLDTEYENFGLLGEDPDEVVAGLTDDRARFLGPGAPRGIWGGVKFSF